MSLHESGENYLETILIQQNKLSRIRSIDIVNALGYSKPTISIAMKQLRERGYIEMDSEGYITLTDKGRKIAKNIYDKHRVIATILISFGVSKETAFNDACKIEHCISDETFACLKEYVNSQ